MAVGIKPDAVQTTLEMLLSILNLDFIRKDIEFVRIYKEILYASDGMLMGGYLAQMYMGLYPDKIKGFISIDSAPLQKSYIGNIDRYLYDVKWNQKL